jgi:hypothetical protein
MFPASVQPDDNNVSGFAWLIQKKPKTWLSAKHIRNVAVTTTGAGTRALGQTVYTRKSCT